MDLSNLATFVDIAETKSFSQSARNMNLSQPAVSKRIAALESVLTIKLFDRSGGTVRLTEYGELLLPSARQIQADLIRIEEAIDTTRNKVTGSLRVGVTNYAARYQLPGVLKQFSDIFTDVSINLRFGTKAELFTGMQDESLELALVSVLADSPEGLPEGMDCTEIMREELVIVVSADHPLNHQSSASVYDLAQVPVIMPAPGSELRKEIDQKLLQHSLYGNVIIQSDDYDLIRTMVSCGLGWACVPRTIVDATLAVITVPELTFDSYATDLITRRDRTLSRAANAFLDFLPDTCGIGNRAPRQNKGVDVMQLQ